MTAAEVVELVKGGDGPREDWHADLKAAVGDLCGRLDSRALAGRFRHFARRNFGGRMLDAAGTDRTKTNRWAVFRVGPVAGKPPPASPASPAGAGGGAAGAGDAGAVPAGRPRRFRNDDRPNTGRGRR